MNGCNEFLNRINEYIDGELDTAAADEMRRHLDECAACRAEYEALLAIAEVTRECAAEPPAELKTRVMAQIKDEKATKKSYIRQFGSLAAAALILAAVWGASTLINQAEKATADNAAPEDGLLMKSYVVQSVEGETDCDGHLYKNDINDAMEGLASGAFDDRTGEEVPEGTAAADTAELLPMLSVSATVQTTAATTEKLSSVDTEALANVYVIKNEEEYNRLLASNSALALKNIANSTEFSYDEELVAAIEEAGGVCVTYKRAGDSILLKSDK